VVQVRRSLPECFGEHMHMHTNFNPLSLQHTCKRMRHLQTRTHPQARVFTTARAYNDTEGIVDGVADILTHALFSVSRIGVLISPK
jgi:hypothetical protein